MVKSQLFVYIFFLTSISKAYTQNISVKDSLLQIIEKQTDDTNKVKLLYEIGDVFENSFPDTAKKYIRIGGSLSKKINYKTGIYKYYRHISYPCIIKSEYDSVIYYNKLGLEYARLNRDTFDIGLALFNIGVAFRFKSEYDSAITYNLEGARLLENRGYIQIEASLYDNLQVLYMSIFQYNKAIAYGEKAVKIGGLLKDKNPLAVALSNLALSYMEVNELDKARNVSNKAIEISQKINNKSVEGAALNNLGDIAIRESHFDLLINYAQKSLKIHTELNSTEGLCVSNRNLAIYFLTHKELDKASEFCNRALKIAEKNELKQEKSQCYKTLSNIAFIRGNFALGYNYMFQSQKIESEIFNESVSQKEVGIRVKYDTEKKESQIQQLEADKKIKELTIHKKNVLNFILLGGIGWVLVISFLIYRNFRHRHKLQQQHIHKLETEKQLAATEAVLKGEEQERTRLAKDLHDGLGGMLSGIKYSFTTMKGNLIMTPDNHQAFERSMDMLDSSIKEMRRVAHNMMPEALVRFGLDTALKDFCNDINQSGALNVNYQSIGMENVQLEQTTNITIYRVIQELLNNTMKHAIAGSAIVQLTKTESQLVITVEDDGKGFDTEILKVNKGIGWINIQNRVEFLKGKLDIHSKTGEGTSVQIELPA